MILAFVAALFDISFGQQHNYFFVGGGEWWEEGVMDHYNP